MHSEKRVLPVTAARFGESHLVWFRPSRSFILMEKPAWDVFSGYRDGFDITGIALRLAAKYHAGYAGALKFARTVIRNTSRYLDPARQQYTPPLWPAGGVDSLSGFFRVAEYCVKGCFFSFSYGNKRLFEIIHPGIAHLEVPRHLPAQGHFELFETEGLYAFRYNGKNGGIFRPRELHYLKGEVFRQLLSATLGIRNDGWMMTLHASGITDGKSAILFQAGAGSGKTTLAALLGAAGYTIIADDFVPISKKTKRVTPFPAALSLKESSWELLQNHYPGLLHNTREFPSAKGGRVRYLPLKNLQPGELPSFPVRAVVFISYNPGESFQFRKLDKKEAITSLLAETWIHPTARNVASFFSWVKGTDFYRLVYPDNLRISETIQKLFDGDL